ncbi:MAG: dTDP-4-dehydrorhamnose reductase [Fimbriimonadaceae bacterium]
MNVVVVGSQGMLGSDVVAEFQSSGHRVLPLDIGDIDITRAESVASFLGHVAGHRFDWCINCAAYTAVDKAETEPDLATAVNGLGPGYLARACLIAGMRFLQIGTDFVFDGNKRTPYVESDPALPLGVYGRSKLAGERSAMEANPGTIVARTAWLFGPNGSSFPKTMIRAWRAGKKLRVVADQIGSPTYTGDLARTLREMAERDLPPGVYHTAGPDSMSWHALAHYSIRAYRDQFHPGEPEPIIDPIATEDWPTPAVRPAYSVLSGEKLRAAGIEPMRHLPEAMREFVRRLGSVDRPTS